MRDVHEDLPIRVRSWLRISMERWRLDDFIIPRRCFCVGGVAGAQGQTPALMCLLRGLDRCVDQGFRPRLNIAGSRSLVMLRDNSKTCSIARRGPACRPPSAARAQKIGFASAVAAFRASVFNPLRGQGRAKANKQNPAFILVTFWVGGIFSYAGADSRVSSKKIIQLDP